MEIVEIKRKDAIKAYKSGSRSEKKLLENLFGKEVLEGNVMDRIKDLGDILQDNGITKFEFDESNKDLEDDEIAYRIIKLLAKSLNQGWEPDWNNSREYKYSCWFNMGSSGSGFSCNVCDYWVTVTYVGSRLCFKSSELAKYAGEQFTDVYKQYMIIN